MKKEFVNPVMNIKSFNKENLVTMSGEVSSTNEQAVTTALDTKLSSASGNAEVKKSSYKLVW